MADGDGRSAPPVFVVGCGRSGSTMLRLMLDAHPEVAVPGESHFIAPLWRHRSRYTSSRGFDAERLARDIARTPHFRHWKIPEERFLQRVRALERPSFASVVEAAFLANAEHHGKRRWVDKTPIYVLHLPTLARLFPQARFVHLIRDGRDVALSYLSVPWGPSSVWQAAWKWDRDVGAGRRAGPALGPGRYLEIRYEDLVRDPRAELERLCRFIELELTEEMLEHHRQVDPERLAPRSGLPFHAGAAAPPRPGVRDWRTQMSERDVRAFEAVAGRRLEEMGYERRFRSVPLTARARGRATAHALAALHHASDLKRALRHRVTGRPPARIAEAG